MRVRIVTTAKGLPAHSRIECYAKALQIKGFSVEVISAVSNPKHSSQKLKSHSQKTFLHKALLKDKTFKYSIFNHLWTVFVSYYLSFNTVVRSKTYDVCILYISSVWPKIIILFFLKYITHKKTILEVNEYPIATEGNKITRIPIVKYFLRQLTFKIVFPLASGFFVISESLKGVVDQYVSHSKVLKVPILVNDLPKSQVDKLSLDQQNLYIFHAGSLSIQKDGIINVFKAFIKAHQYLKNKHDIKLSIVITNNKTHSYIWQKIKQILEENNLTNKLKITGYLTDEQLKAYQENALAMLVNKPQSFQNKYNFPTKLSSYLASRRPVIVAAENLELNNFLKHDHNAFVIKPDDVDGMAQSIINTYENPEKVNRIVTKAVDVVEKHFYFKSQSERLKNFIQNL